MEKYFIKRLPKPVPETYNNPHVDYWDGQESTALYLCSRAIQVGDIVEELLLTGVYEKFEIHTENDIDLERQFEVIGEISPDALSYVKEGQEFDDHSVRKNVWIELYYADAEEQFQYYSQFINVDKDYSTKGGTPLYHETIINETIEIKGPCGHFH